MSEFPPKPNPIDPAEAAAQFGPQADPEFWKIDPSEKVNLSAAEVEAWRNSPDFAETNALMANKNIDARGNAIPGPDAPSSDEAAALDKQIEEINRKAEEGRAEGKARAERMNHSLSPERAAYVNAYQEAVQELGGSQIVNDEAENGQQSLFHAAADERGEAAAAEARAEVEKQFQLQTAPRRLSELKAKDWSAAETVLDRYYDQAEQTGDWEVFEAISKELTPGEQEAFIRHRESRESRNSKIDSPFLDLDDGETPPTDGENGPDWDAPTPPEGVPVVAPPAPPEPQPVVNSVTQEEIERREEEELRRRRAAKGLDPDDDQPQPRRRVLFDDDLEQPATPPPQPPEPSHVVGKVEVGKGKPRKRGWNVLGGIKSWLSGGEKVDIPPSQLTTPQADIYDAVFDELLKRGNFDSEPNAEMPALNDKQLDAIAAIAMKRIEEANPNWMKEAARDYRKRRRQAIKDSKKR